MELCLGNAMLSQSSEEGELQSAGMRDTLSAVGQLQNHSCWHLAQVSSGQGQKPGSKGEALMGFLGRGC